MRRIFENVFLDSFPARQFGVAVVPGSHGTGNKLSDLSISSTQSDINATLKLSGERSISPVVYGWPPKLNPTHLTDQ